MVHRVHEEDGAKVQERVALLVKCREKGHIYKIEYKDMKHTECRECGCKEYDIIDEIYRNEEQEDG